MAEPVIEHRQRPVTWLPSRRIWSPAALAVGVLLLFDPLRGFLPSLVTLYGRAGDTPAEQMGLFAAVWAPRVPFSDHLPVVVRLRVT